MIQKKMSNVGMGTKQSAVYKKVHKLIKTFALEISR